MDSIGGPSDFTENIIEYMRSPLLSAQLPGDPPEDVPVSESLPPPADETAARRADMERLQLDHAAQLASQKALYESQISNLQADAARLQTLLTKATSQARTLEAETKRLQAKDDTTDQVDDLKNENLLLADQMDDLQRSRDEAQTKLGVVASSLERHLETETSLRKELSAARREASDAKAQLARAKTRWEAREKELVHEMELRSQLLFLEWGRQEVGPPEKGGLVQGYKLKYAKGSGTQMQ
jgi:chromosome segregation ATPase